MKSERYLISAHFDHEVDPPWDQVVAKKIVQDPTLSKEWEMHSRVRTRLQELGDPGDIDSAALAVKSKLEALLAGYSKKKNVHELLGWRVVGWAAAVAIFGLTFGGVGYWLGIQSRTGSSSVAEVHVKLPQNYSPPLQGDSQLIKMTSFEGGGR